MILVAVLAGLLTLACLVPVLARLLGRRTGYLLGLFFFAGAAGLATTAPEVLRQEGPELALEWLPELGVRFVLVLDGLSLLFSLLVLFIGGLVMVYSAHYLEEAGSHGRLFALLTFFTVSMLGLVLAGDVILLFVFWELTSISSFFLIGEGGPESRRSATRALLVTGLGGLALFAGLVLMGTITGTFDLGEILASDLVARSSLGPVIAILLLLGAFTKSAQFPFHFWLPGAMVAPTPVSTYLHAATLVKAGVYLLARLSPLFADTSWRYLIIFTGLLTAVIGAGIALKQHDLKALLAYSTVSQLGLLIALVGVGTFYSLAAMAVLTVAHGLYKATLFMLVGVIDKEAGSRDIRQLSGLRHAMPRAAGITAVAAMSMAGLPPLLGFVSKEEAFAAFLGGPGGGLAVVAALLAVAASIMTFAYGARILYGTFGGPLTQRLYEPSASFLAPGALAAAIGLLLGPAVAVLDSLTDRIATDALLEEGAVHLSLWHGFTPALGLSAITVAGGVLLFTMRDRVDRMFSSLAKPLGGERSFDALHSGLVKVGDALGRPFLSTDPARHLSWVVLSLVALVGLVVWEADVPGDEAPASLPADWVLTALLLVSCVGIARVRDRLAAAALLGITGFLVALVYMVLGAPDLVMTQLLVETLTVVLVVLVFKRLPRSFPRTSTLRRFGALAAALVVGVLAATATFFFTGRRGTSEAGTYFLEAASEEAGGMNVVNTILVDFRALDTLGEIAVLAAAAVGVFGLVTLVRNRR